MDRSEKDQLSFVSLVHSFSLLGSVVKPHFVHDLEKKLGLTLTAFSVGMESTFVESEMS